MSRHPFSVSMNQPGLHREHPIIQYKQNLLLRILSILILPLPNISIKSLGQVQKFKNMEMLGNLQIMFFDEWATR
jgi:hypothetical protein